MKLTQIDIDSVHKDCDHGQTTKFNTCFHSAESLPQGIEAPSEAPYAFRRRLPLILESRGLNSSAAQIIHLSRHQAQVIVDSSASSILAGQLNRAAEEDLQDEVFPTFRSLIYPPEGLFMRLDGCSPKDATCRLHGGRQPQSVILSTMDIILWLSSSQRAMNDIRRSLSNGCSDVAITFLPFQERMCSEREYRVFCAPVSAKITAISQYRWHNSWKFSNVLQDEKVRVASDIYSAIQALHERILQQLKPAEPLDAMLLKQGLSFDVFYDEENEQAQLVELNVFGARSGCGSCLFGWLGDLALLYGEQEEVEFRVAY